MTPKDNYKKWKADKELIGWKAFYAFVPADLAEQLRLLKLKYKYHNPQHYKRL